MDTRRALEQAIKAFCGDRLGWVGKKTHPTYMFATSVLCREIEKSITLKLLPNEQSVHGQIKDELTFVYSQSTDNDFMCNMSVKETFRNDVITLWVRIGNGSTVDTGFRFYWLDGDLLQYWESVSVSRTNTRRVKPA